MKKLLFLIILFSTSFFSYAQFIHKIKADSVLITNDSCTAELNLENSTKHIKGFLYNKGNGRTEFRKGFINSGDSLYIIGDDTLTVNFGLYWKHGGNSFGNPGKIGTLDNHHMDFYSNNIFRSRLTDSGNWLIGTNTDNGERFRVNGNARVDSLFSARVIYSDFSFNSRSPVSSWSEMNFYIRDTATRQGVIGTANTSSRDTRDLFVAVGDSYQYTDYPLDGTGFHFDIRTGYNSANRTTFWRNGNVSVGTDANTYRLTHKFAVAGKGIFTDTLTATTMGGTDSSNRVATTAFVKNVLGSSGSSSGITINSTPITSGNSGRILYENSSNQVSESNRLNWNNTDSVLNVTGSLILGGTGTTPYITPYQSSSVPTKISIPTFDPGSGGQVLAMGVPSTAPSNARVMMLLDARTSAHQPSIGLLDHTESDIVGFSWDGSDNVAAIKTMSSDFVFRKNTTDIVYINSSSLNTGFGGNTAPEAKLHPAAGTATANTAPLKFTAGTNLSSPENGAVEYDANNYFVTANDTRYILAKTLTATATLDFASTAAQVSTDLTITVTGASTGDAVSLGVPNAAILTNSSFSAWVSASNTVTVRFNNHSSSAKNPASGTFRATIIKY